MLNDLRYAVRMLLKNPGFAVIAIVTLALGIGANTAIFSVLNAVLLRPLPVRDPDRLVMIWRTYPKGNSFPIPMSFPDFEDWKSRSHVFENIAAFAEHALNLSGVGEPLRVQAIRVSPSFFRTVGVEPILGRPFLPEDQSSNGRVVMLGHRHWQGCFDSDPNIVGRTVRLDGEEFTVIGILPAKRVHLGGSFETQSDLWIPLNPRAFQHWNDRGWGWLSVCAQLKPDVTLKQAGLEMDVIARSIEKEYPGVNQGWGARLVPFQENLTGSAKPLLLMLMGAVGFVP